MYAEKENIANKIITKGARLRNVCKGSSKECEGRTSSGCVDL